MWRTGRRPWSFFVLIRGFRISAARECKRKWNTLRIQKRRILNQQSKKGKAKHTVLWQFFDALDFLMPHMEWM